MKTVTFMNAAVAPKGREGWYVLFDDGQINCGPFKTERGANAWAKGE